MKAVLISVHAKWCALMMNGKKTVEVRKGTALYKAIQKLIDEYGYADIYVYCTKGKPYLGKKEIGRNFYNEPIYTYDLDYGETFKGSGNKKFYSSVGVYSINGKVIFKFRCYKVEEIKLPYTKFGTNEWVGCENERKWQTPTMNEDKLLDLSCLQELELYGYLKGKTSTAIHISDLEIFDKPKELSEFGKREKIIECYNAETNYHTVKYRKCKLTKTPQSWCYIEVI